MGPLFNSFSCLSPLQQPSGPVYTVARMCKLQSLAGRQQKRSVAPAFFLRKAAARLCRASRCRQSHYKWPSHTRVVVCLRRPTSGEGRSSGWGLCVSLARARFESRVRHAKAEPLAVVAVRYSSFAGRRSPKVSPGDGRPDRRVCALTIRVAIPRVDWLWNVSGLFEVLRGPGCRRRPSRVSCRDRAQKQVLKTGSKQVHN